MRQTQDEWEAENEVFPDPGQAIMDLQAKLSRVEAERDAAIKEAGEYRNMINNLVFEGNVITSGTARRVKQHLAKYKKEEQK